MRNRLLYIFVITIIFSSPLYANKIRVAILDFQPKDISEADAVKVSELIRNEMVNIGKFIVVERAQMTEILKEQGFQQTGCTDTSCAVQIGKLLSANKMIVGFVMKLGNKIIITGRMIDIEKGIAEFSEKSTADNEDEIYDAVLSFTKKFSDRIAIPIEKKEEAKKKKKEDRKKHVTRKRKFQIGAGFIFMTTFGSFKEIADIGMGGSLNLSMNVIKNLDVGISSGYYNFIGKGKYTDKFTAIPFLATIGYRFFVTKYLYLKPVISVGGIYASLKQKSFTGKSITKSNFENLLKGGLGLGYILWKDLYIQLNAEYNTIIEKGGMMQFVSLNAGIGYRL